MTAQFPDLFLFNETEYAIAGIHGDAPFDPTRFGLHPVGCCTACWRGYVCTFTHFQDRLILTRLDVNLGKYREDRSFDVQVGPAINSREPALPVDQFGLFNNIYTELDLPLSFSGGLLIARDFIQELYVHMGFHPAWKFQEVWELIFGEGRLIESRNVSQAMADLRARLHSHPDDMEWDENEILERIRSAFRLDY
jgi:hypothetical protein